MTVVPNTNYSFSAWAVPIGLPPSTLEFSINSQAVGTPLTLPNTSTCGWTQFTAQWNSGTNISANICIVSKNGTVSGNDFAIDDLSFKKTDTPAFDSITAQANFDTVNAQLATILSSPGNLNYYEFGGLQNTLNITQNNWSDAAGNFITTFTSFTKDEAWARVQALLSLPTPVQVLWSQVSVKYHNDASGTNERYFYSYVIQQASGTPKQIMFATEFLPGYGWRKVYLVGKDFPLPPIPSVVSAIQVGACCPAGSQWDSSQGKCTAPLAALCTE